VAPYVADALRSALDQTIENLEVIVVDDGSTDATVEIVRSIPDARIRLFERSHQGAVSAANAALMHAGGEYLAFLDGDDVWHREKLARHVQFLDEDPALDATFSWFALIDESGRRTGVLSRRWKGTLSFEQLLRDNVVGNGSSMVARRSALVQAGGFDESFDACHDLDIWLRVALQRPGNLACVPGFLTYYRQRSDQMTKNAALMESSWNQVLEKMRRIAPRQTGLVAAEAASNMSRYFAYIVHENGDYQGSGAYLSRSFREAPLQFLSDLRSWKMLAANTAALAFPAPWYRALRVAALRLSAHRRPSTLAQDLDP
jgi:glycosyltransferase involved in cell wall biosynthesis